MAETFHQWTLAARPLGRALAETDFDLELAQLPELRDGEVVVRTQWLAFDPALKGWMENIAGYVDAMAIGDPMRGSGLGEVVQSRHADFAPGDIVHGPLGWREMAVVDAALLARVPDGTPPTASLGVLGTTGLTAYLALVEIGKPKPGDTVVISAAAGATGSVAGQIAKLAGCRVIGLAGGPEKCAWLVDELGFDAAVDYRNDKVRARLRELCPDGIDVMFDNVGGEILDDCLARLAVGARVVICGGISRYNFDPRDAGQMPPGPRNYFNLVFTGATMQGFLLPRYEAQIPLARRRLTDWVGSGALRYKEDIQTGFENAPRTLMRLFEGRNFGKQLLRL
ncbi:NADPH-dependent curcumin reductase CurA [Caulobacter ginsengisoli]|uniref:NADPH-dependent curcumin reductase CurA n=1 Tax=Caulobacter ginsengisoli TaxID=400775 RepID=A0ABU0J027_9CAUL|nr:NADP-dependent oxidoreductase [Caulobacter ginsengisoli]MDQ0466906.1 NADPH-dependent curcumin reductase CurA [Caulobacter ginsengisoli]